MMPLPPPRSSAAPHAPLRPPAAPPAARLRAAAPCRPLLRRPRPLAFSATAAPPAVVVEQLSVRYGDSEALRGASLSVPAGTLHMLLGRNGCGKSTLLRACAGLARASGGRVEVATPRAFVFQNPDHQVVMPSVGADVAFGLARLGLPDQQLRERVAEALQAVGLQGFELRPVHTLSGGQKQRVAIAGALAERPQVLLLDELTTFLDPGDQAAVLECVRAAVDGPRRVTALWVTHRLEELGRADGASLMEAGRVVKTTWSGEEMMRHLRKEWKLV